MDKNALRRLIGEKKRAMDAAQVASASARLAERLFATPQYREARSLYAYLSFNQEVRTAPIIERAWADGKRVAVPRITGGEMAFIWIDSFDSLAENRFGIPEPVGDGHVADDAHALVLMPGLAFDTSGHRVGYGGGYYDRFLAREPGHPLIALCYGFQLFEHLDAEAHDIPADMIITEL